MIQLFYGVIILLSLVGCDRGVSSLGQISVYCKQKGFYIRCDQSVLYQKEHLNKHAWWWIDGRRLTGRHKRGDSGGISIPRLILLKNEPYWEHAANKFRRIEGDDGPV